MQSTLELTDLNRRIGRVFMAGIPGYRLDEGTKALIRDYGLGGVILFNRNIQDPVQLTELCGQLQQVSMEHHGIPLFLAVDQEGGPVARLGDPFTRFPGNTVIGGDNRPVERAEEYSRVTAKEMSLVGLNMNLAPVVDVQWEETEPHLNGRTFGDNPEKVALLGKTVIEVLQKNGIMAVAKHFPGLGKAPMDPHQDLPIIEVDEEEMEAIHLPPFQAAIGEAVSGIMTSHAVYPALDPDSPCTLSQKILTGLLRKTMGFEGLIITDDLEMGAIKKTCGVPDGAVAAFEAGADILLICHDHAEVLKAIQMLRSKLLKGLISAQRMVDSLERIQGAKTRFLTHGGGESLANVRSYFGL